MTIRSVFRGTFWTLIALLLVVHVWGAWAFSDEIIEDGLTPDPDAISLPVGGPRLEEVAYESDLGDLDAWYIPAGGDAWVIHVHGKGVTPSTDAEFLFQPLHDAGYPQLAITYRNDEGQPRDPSGFYQYGVTEWADLAGAMEYAEANGAQSIIFYGFGAGASHVLSFVYKHRFDDVKGLVLDSPNIDFGDTVEYNASQRDMPLIPTKVWPTITWAAKFAASLRVGVNWQSINYVDDAAAFLRVPVLVIHGTEDESVPVTQSIAFAGEAPQRVRLVQVDGAAHVASYEAQPEEYLVEVLDFIEGVS